MTPDRQQRIDAIRQAAEIRRCLGQAARHRRLPDGRHVIILRGQRYLGATLQEAIAAAREGRESQP